MIFGRIELLIKRFLKARNLGFLFFAARYFYIPKSIKINNKIINLYPYEDFSNSIYNYI